MFTRIFLSVVALSLVAAYPISDKGCQCQGECEKGNHLQSVVYEPKCKVTDSICTDASDVDKDKCGNSALSSAKGTIGNLLQRLAGGAARAKQKLGEWSEENLKKLPIDKIKEYGGNLSTAVMRKLSSAQLHSIPVGDIKEWTKDKLNKFQDSDFARFTEAQVQGMNASWAKEKIKSSLDAGKAISKDLLEKISAEQLKEVSVETIEKFKRADWQSLNLEAVKEWTQEKIQAIPVDDIKAFTKEQLAKIPVDKMKDFAKAQFDAMTWENIGGFLKEQWDRVPVDTIVGFTWEKIQQVPWEKLGNFTKEQWDKLPLDKLIRLAGRQINKINATKLQYFTQRYWDAVPIEHVAHFTAEQLQVSGILPDLDPARVAQISDSAWKGMPVGEMLGFTASQLQRVNYTSMSKWTKEKWDSIKVDEMLKLTGRRLREVPPEKVANWTKKQWNKIPVDDIVVFSGEQINKAAILAKLEIEQLAALAKEKGSELDMELLLADKKAELEAYLKKKKEECGDKCTVSNLKDLIFKYDDAQDKADKAAGNLATIQNTPFSTEDAKTAAVDEAKDAVNTAVAEKDAVVEELAKESYTPAAEKAPGTTEASPDGSSVGQLTVGVFVALATMCA